MLNEKRPAEGLISKTLYVCISLDLQPTKSKMPTSCLRDTQYELKKCLAEQGVEFVLDELERRLRRSRTSIFNDLALLKAKYLNAKKAFVIQGTIEYRGEFDIVANRTREGLLVLIDALTEADLRPPDEDIPLIQALRRLPIDLDKATEPLYLVNCDRVDAKKTYSSARRQKIGAPLQFFLVQACPEQMPHSFAERLIREEVKKLESDPDAQVYFKPNGPERILIQGLTVESGGAEETLDTFKSDFSRAHADFFRSNYSHAAFAFALHETNWDDSLPECLDEILAWQRNLCGKSRRLFAFFLVVYIKNFDKPEALTSRQVAIREQLEAFARRTGDMVTAISLKIPGEEPGESARTPAQPIALLHPVPQDEVEKWLHRIAQDGHAPNYREILDQFDRYIEETNPARYRKNGPYDMRDVQELQKMVRQVAQEQAQS